MRVAQSLAPAVWTGRDAFPRPKGNRQRQSSRWRVQREGEEQGPQAAAWSQRWLTPELCGLGQSTRPLCRLTQEMRMPIGAPTS